MLFALVALFVLLILGLYLRELRASHVVFTLAIAAGGLFVFNQLGWPILAYTAVLAAIDIVLILVIFKGDIRIR
jgi:hypothetical protein